MRVSWKEQALVLGCVAKPLDAGALECMAIYGWPGNVRELENVLTRALVFSEGAEIQAEDLSLPIPLERSSHESFRTEKARMIRAFEREYLKKCSTVTMATSHTPLKPPQRIGGHSGNCFTSMACRWDASASQLAQKILGRTDE